jgi:hypothetical protein
MKRVTLGAVAILTLIAAPALAQGMGGQSMGGMGGQGMGGPGQGWLSQYCKADIDKFCPGMKHGTGAIPKCLAINYGALSPACRTALNNKGPGWRQNQ